jgi:hypothetical protein
MHSDQSSTNMTDVNAVELDKLPKLDGPCAIGD